MKFTCFECECAVELSLAEARDTGWFHVTGDGKDFEVCPVCTVELRYRSEARFQAQREVLRAIRKVEQLHHAPLQRLADGTIVAQTAAALVEYERELQWNHRRVAALLMVIHGGQRQILEALVELGEQVSVYELADKLGRSASGLGPSLAAIAKRARKLFPGSPAPVRSDGEPGQVVVRVDPTFLDVLRLLAPTRDQLAAIRRDLDAAANEQEKIARDWSAVDADGLDEASS